MQFKLVLSQDTSLTCDSWFGVKNWVEYHVSTPLTVAMSDTQGGGLWQLFGHQLKHQEYRNFTNGKIIVTLYQDNALIKTASTMFKTGKVDSQMTTPFEALQTNVQPPAMQLTEVGIQTLGQLPKEDLVKLASALGKPHNMVQKLCC
jgi:hypothetical protein